MKTEKFVEALGVLNPFGAVRFNLPTVLGQPCLNLKQMKKLHRQLGTEIKRREKWELRYARMQAKAFNRAWTKLLKGGVFKPSPLIRGVHR